MRIARLFRQGRSVINDAYRDFDKLESQPYQTQYEQITSRNYDNTRDVVHWLGHNGHEVFDIIQNADVLNATWLEEFGIDTAPTVIQQLKAFNAEILWYDAYVLDAGLIDRIRSEVTSLKRLIATCCSPITAIEKEWLKKADYVVTCSLKFVREFKEQGIRPIFLRHGFPDSWLKISKGIEKKHSPIFFSGALSLGSDHHKERMELIHHVISRKIAMDIYADINPIHKEIAKNLGYYCVKGLMLQRTKLARRFQNGFVPLSIRRACMPPLYGNEMIKEMSRYFVTLNVHAGVAGDYAANIRLFEATGVGSCLLTDWKSDLAQLFDVGSEVMAYRNIDECAEMAVWLQGHKSVAMEMGQNARKRVMQNHLVSHRMEEFSHMLEKIT